MGNGASFAKYTFVFEEGASDPPLVTPGQKLTGQVVVDISQQVPARDVAISLEGCERTFVQYTAQVKSGSGKHYVRKSRTASGYRVLHEATEHVDVSAFIQDGNFGPGRYALPFVFDIPPDPISSLKLSHGDDSVSISYIIHIYLPACEGCIRWHCKHQDVLVQGRRTRPLGEPVPFQGLPTTVPLTGWYCFPRGSVTFAAMVSNTVVSRGTSDTVIRMACRNDSRETVEGVQIALQEVWQWTTSRLGVSHSSTHTLVSVPFERSRFVSVAKDQDLPSVLRSVSERNHLYDDVKASENTVSLTVPDWAHLTYSSSLVTISHRLVLELQTRKWVNSPSIMIPFQCVDSLPLEELSTATELTIVVADPTTVVSNIAMVPSPVLDPVEADVVLAPADMISSGTPLHGDEPDDIPVLAPALAVRHDRL